MGCIAVALMLGAEFTLVLGLRGLTVRQYLWTRDPVSGSVYYILIGIFAIKPLIVRQR